MSAVRQSHRCGRLQGLTQFNVFRLGNAQQVVVTRGPGFAFYLLYLIAIVYWFWNKGYLEGTTGKSLAKRFLGYSTVSEATNKPLGAGPGLLRALLVYIELILIGLCGLGLIL